MRALYIERLGAYCGSVVPIILAGMASCCAVGLGGSDAFGAGSSISVLCERNFGKVHALSEAKFA